MTDFSYISNAHPSYIDALYNQYLEAPESLDGGWRSFFEGFEYSAKNGGAASSAPSDAFTPKELSVFRLIDAFRERGHLLATTNPIRKRRDRKPHLDLADYGLTDADLKSEFYAGSAIGMPGATLEAIIARLKRIYAGNIGFEFEHLEKYGPREWLRERIESLPAQGYGHSLETKKRILEKLNGATVFENFLATKYVAQKRFGLEGGESAIAALDAAITTAAEKGVKEVIIGMAHRGRLNVLANIMGKTYDQIFNEFEDLAVPDLAFGDGDVKYHLGFSSQMKTPLGKEVELQLAPNPSHLEAVNPVVEGFARAKADILYGNDYDKILPILIHGDAAIAGQGIVFEVVQMSQLDGYYTGGTLHFVINNQIGFTTDFDDARSSTYCTDVAKVVKAPVFHVNGDDPEAVVFAIQLAAEYRAEFHGDVFIDMVCYRKHGHNEGDDPQFTQPQLYKLIKKHKDPRKVYTEQLISQGTIEKEMAESMQKEFKSFLQDRLDSVRQKPLPHQYQEPELAWKKLKGRITAADIQTSPKTGVKKETLIEILNKLQTTPEGFTPLPKYKRIQKNTQKFLDADSVDWGMAELAAYGSLLLEGRDVRMSGQDVKRGTFSHRNAVLYDFETNEQYNRLNDLGDKQGDFHIYNSLLSEFGVLGFEFGYSMASPDSLVIWEAQFGDFSNGAQTIWDQFISSSESKWQRNSGLVALLPHGYEGQGPEHSSARLERFLLMCAEFNITVANLTTPANLFHILRRQIVRDFRKPLIIMSPKSLLRHKLVVSKIDDLAKGEFHEIYDDAEYKRSKKKAEAVTRVLCCSGKVYFDLLDYKEQNKRSDTAIVRLEQLYPFPKDQVDAMIRRYPNANFAWVQEEPSNMGAWQYVNNFYRKYDLRLIARKSSASPATGFKKVHMQQQQDIVDRAFSFE